MEIFKNPVLSMIATVEVLSYKSKVTPALRIPRIPSTAQHSTAPTWKRVILVVN
jgi:hypothetical protein